MRSNELIEGLVILNGYMTNPKSFNIGAEHDVVYFYKTDKPVTEADLRRLVDLGWFQENTNYHDDEETGGDFGVKHYDPEESWSARV